MMYKERKRGVATNSIILSFVQCFTLLTGVVQTMILSHKLSEIAYGTYSEGLLVVNFATPFLLLGLSNAITYFSSQTDINKKEYVNNIMTLIFLLGLSGGVLIIFVRDAIVSYFDSNSLLTNVIPLVAFLPLLKNLISSFQTLYIAENMSMSIAIRNAVVSCVQISIVAVGVLVYDNIYIIFSLLLLMDIAQVVIFECIFSNKKYLVYPVVLKPYLIRRILAYALPLALSTAVGTISIYMDKLLIGNLMSVEDFALYSNMAKELPFSFIVSSFTTVILPVFVGKHAQGKDEELSRIWRDYLKLGYLITWILVGAALVCSENLLVFLYSDRYIRGIQIFRVYLLVTMLRFSYFGIVLSAFGKTKLILLSSIASLITNFVLNILLFKWVGMIGPAIASFVAIFVMQVFQMTISCKLLQTKIWRAMDLKFAGLLIGEIIVIGYLIYKAIEIINLGVILDLIVGGGSFCLILFLLNRKRIFELIYSINNV